MGFKYRACIQLLLFIGIFPNYSTQCVGKSNQSSSSMAKISRASRSPSNPRASIVSSTVGINMRASRTSKSRRCDGGLGKGLGGKGLGLGLGGCGRGRGGRGLGLDGTGAANALVAARTAKRMTAESCMITSVGFKGEFGLEMKSQTEGNRS